MNHFLHMCGKFWSEWRFLPSSVTLCLKGSTMMKVEELAMTNSWCHGLIECVWRWDGLLLTGLHATLRSPLDTLMLVAGEAPPEINWGCDVSSGRWRSMETLLYLHLLPLTLCLQMFHGWFFPAWCFWNKQLEGWENELHSHVVYKLHFKEEDVVF